MGKLVFSTNDTGTSEYTDKKDVDTDLRLFTKSSKLISLNKK